MNCFDVEIMYNFRGTSFVIVVTTDPRCVWILMKTILKIRYKN